MRARSVAWWTMALLALGVAGYALHLVLVPGARPPLAQALLVKSPVAAFSHFIGGALALAVGVFQLNTRLRVRFASLHRWFGRIYVLAVLFGGIAGFTLAVHSTGGPFVQWGFGLLAVSWLGSTFGAYRYIRRRNLAAHRDWMIRSYALTLAAVTVRLYLPSAQLADLPMAMAYPAIAWLSWVPNLLLAEWIIRSRRAPAVLPGSAATTSLSNAA
ncbi:DUF2306 domain-containing protein [Povalibacter sp.]|uniref:DUF2306 domain-containing protein n=1 Tax=Povalibacter sp. TaxID=1962978 RepID=UPI002F3E6D0C